MYLVSVHIGHMYVCVLLVGLCMVCVYAWGELMYVREGGNMHVCGGVGGWSRYWHDNEPGMESTPRQPRTCHW